VKPLQLQVQVVAQRVESSPFPLTNTMFALDTV